MNKPRELSADVKARVAALLAARGFRTRGVLEARGLLVAGVLKPCFLKAAVARACLHLFAQPALIFNAYAQPQEKQENVEEKSHHGERNSSVEIAVRIHM